MLFCLIRICTFFVAIAILVVGCQLSGNNSYASDALSDQTQQEISTLLDQYIQALLDKNLTELDRIWSDELTFVNPQGELFSKKNRMDNVKSGATAFKSIRLSEVSVRSYSQAAVATFQVTLEAHYSGRENSGSYRVTTVWAQPKGAWQLVAVQMTRITQ